MSSGFLSPLFFMGLANFGEYVPPPTVVPDVGFVNGLYVQITVTNYHGVPLGELAADVESVTWLLNEAGRARLDVPNPGTAAELIQFGNRVLIEFDNGLADWTGYIDPPRRWRYGSAMLTVYGGERLLKHRVTDRGRYFTRATAGAMLRALLQEQAAPPVVEIGSVWLGGGGHSPDYHFKDLYTVARDSLARLEAADFDVTGRMEGGRLRLRANFYARKGFDLADVWLLEGHNIDVGDPEEQGEIVNEWFLAGAGTGWSETARAYSSARDEQSIRAYGLRQGAEILAGVSRQETLDAHAAGNLADSAEPYLSLPFTAINLAPGRFADYGIGDRVNIELYSYFEDGFTGMRRVIGREFRPREGGCVTMVV
ncbi:MAG: hypothetical protein R3C43_19240 [Chloroflexota bacterium]